MSLSGLFYPCLFSVAISAGSENYLPVLSTQAGMSASLCQILPISFLTLHCHWKIHACLSQMKTMETMNDYVLDFLEKKYNIHIFISRGFL